MATPTRGSEAYDLSLFEPKQAKIVPLKPNKKQAKAQQRRSRIQSLLNTAVTLALAGLVITSLGMMVAGRVRITEMDAQITTQQEQLSNLQSEHVRLTSELAAKTSAQSVEDYATENPSSGITGQQKDPIHRFLAGGQKAPVPAGDVLWQNPQKPAGLRAPDRLISPPAEPLRRLTVNNALWI